MHTGSQVPDRGGLGEGGGPEWSDPVTISDACQEFRGERFYKCGFYFQRKGNRLHRIVWAAANGGIERGWHVHHIDGDRSNNSLANLAALPGARHASLHGYERSDESRKIMGRIRFKADAWHGSDAGRAWHSTHYEKHIRAIAERRVDMVCVECGKDYQTAFTSRLSSKFCHQNCKARALRKRRALERAQGRLLPSGS